MKNTEETKRKIAVMQAWCDGKEIQYRVDADDDWHNAAIPQWDWSDTEYRIKPEPRECWVNEYSNGNLGDPKPTKDEARAISGFGYVRTIHMREVLDAD